MRLFRKILLPFSWLYALGVHVRNYLYDIGFLKSQSFRTPIICVGNLTVGGTGKSPMVEWLVRLLSKNGRIAVLSRGYRRKSKGFQLVEAHSNVEDVGDEPLQFASKFPDITVAVDADRRAGIEYLEAHVAPEVIILDDAFQHRRVRSGLNILLTRYGNLYVDDHYLPTGDLRDSGKQAARADIIVITKCPADLSAGDRDRLVARLNPRAWQTVCFATLEYGPISDGQGRSIDPSLLQAMSPTLVTGIADPIPLQQHLEMQGFALEHLRYPDHHFFTERELELLKGKSAILTTEKDFVRLRGHVEKLWYIPIRHRFLFGGASNLRNRISEFRKHCS